MKMDKFLGTWRRYKVENEKEAFEYLGFPDGYEALKDTECVFTVTKNADGSYNDNFKRAQFDINCLYKTNMEVEMDFASGKATGKSGINSEGTECYIELDYRDIHRKHTRTLISDNEFMQKDEYDNGKCLSIQYYKKD